MEQISSKYFLPSLLSNGYLAMFLRATSNWSSIYLSHLVFFWLNCYWFFCKCAGLWAAFNQLAPKYVKESEHAFLNFLSEVSYPKGNETGILNFPLIISLRGKTIVHCIRALNWRLKSWNGNSYWRLLPLKVGQANEDSCANKTQTHKRKPQTLYNLSPHYQNTPFLGHAERAQKPKTLIGELNLI